MASWLWFVAAGVVFVASFNWFIWRTTTTAPTLLNANIAILPTIAGGVGTFLCILAGLGWPQ